MRNLKRGRLLVAGVIGVLFVIGLSPASASSANISHSYNSISAIANGSLVSLDPTRTDYIEPSTTDNGNQLLGVSVATNDSLIAVDPSASAVQVATSGTANVLVSTVNGVINVGSQIAVSPFDGIGMKAGPGDRIIGLSQTSFSASTSGATQQSVTDKSGKQAAIYVGYVRLSIGIGTASTTASSQNALQRFAKSLTGHTVSTVRVIVSVVILIIATIALITLIYTSIYGSIISIGRNPLARFAIFRTLGSVLAMVLVTAGIAAATIFFLLR